MEQKLPFLNMFSAYSPPEPIRKILESWLVVEAVIDSNRRSIEATVLVEENPDTELLDLLEKEISHLYRINQVPICPRPM